jgi:hypothetical protein
MPDRSPPEAQAGVDQGFLAGFENPINSSDTAYGYNCGTDTSDKRKLDITLGLLP